MTGNDLRAALATLTETELDMNVYVLVKGQPWPITEETLFIQWDLPAAPSGDST